MLREIRKPRGDPEVLAAQSREQYFKVLSCSMWECHPILHLTMFVYFLCFFALTISDYSSFSNPMFLLLQLKKRLQILTLGIGGVGLVSAYISYSPEIAARYAHFSLMKKKKGKKI